MQRRFQTLDVFSNGPFSGNPLAVVVDAEGIDDVEMQRFANWTNLSETTFLLPPEDPAADYLVRIFTPTSELPFAGHPTLGSCRAFLATGGRPAADGIVVQECGVGLVRVRVDGERLAFAAPELIRSGPVDDELEARLRRVVRSEIVDLAWADNGPGWVAVELPTVGEVLALEPDFGGSLDLFLGVYARDGEPGREVEVRAFFPGQSSMLEDPVTGSLNASIAQRIMSRYPEVTTYVARQGTALGRDGRVHVDRDGDGAIWVGGAATIRVHGHVDIPSTARAQPEA